MEEIAGFEERLNALRERGEELVGGCPDAVQPRVRQQVQTQQQGTRDSYSAICSTAQRVSTAAPTRGVYREHGKVINLAKEVVNLLANR